MGCAGSISQVQVKESEKKNPQSSIAHSLPVPEGKKDTELSKVEAEKHEPPTIKESSEPKPGIMPTPIKKQKSGIGSTSKSKGPERQTTDSKPVAKEERPAITTESTKQQDTLKYSKLLDENERSYLMEYLAAVSQERVLLINQPPHVKYCNGLVNSSVACYMNVVLQMLVRIPAVREYFLSNEYSKDLDQTRKSTDPMLSDYFGQFIKAYYSVDRKVLDPAGMRSWFGSKNSSFKLDTQEDAHEFILYVLNAMSDELVAKPPMGSNSIVPSVGTPKPGTKITRPRKITQVKKVDNNFEKSWKENQQTNSIFEDTLMGQLITEVQCLTCKEISKSSQTFLLLEVPVPDKESADLVECLAEMCKEEVFEETEGWVCEKCKVKRKAVKRTRISRYPPTLVFYLSRFRVMNQKFTKHLCRVNADEPLNISSFLIPGIKVQEQGNPIYETYGMIVVSPLQLATLRYYKFRTLRLQPQSRGNSNRR